MADGRPTAYLWDRSQFPRWEAAIPPKSRQHARELYDDALRLAEDPADEGAAMENLKQALAYDPDLIEAWYAYGRILFNNGRYQEAVRLLISARTRDGPRAEGHYLLGQAAYMQGDYWQATLSLQRFLARREPYVGNEPIRVAHELLGRMALSQDQYGDAIKWFTAALKAQPEIAEYFYLRGLAYYRWNGHKEAAEDFRRATQLDPSHPAFWNGLASALLLEQEYHIFTKAPEFYRPALKAAKRAVELGPGIADNYFLLGRIYKRLRQPREAADAYRRTVRLRPDNAFLRLWLAQQLLEVPDKTADAEAERHLVQGLALDYDHRVMRLIEPNVSQLLDELIRHYLLDLRLPEAMALLEWAAESSDPEKP